jgi:hypothetical protein
MEGVEFLFVYSFGFHHFDITGAWDVTHGSHDADEHGALSRVCLLCLILEPHLS